MSCSRTSHSPVSLEPVKLEPSISSLVLVYISDYIKTFCIVLYSSTLRKNHCAPVTSLFKK